jgi:putative ABC transport system permease protein
MIKNYLKIALRNLAKYKTYSAINIIGLAIGITSALLILFYIQFQFSFDKLHKDGDRIYRLSIISNRAGNVEGESPVFVPPVGPDMKGELPDVENYTRFSTLRTLYFYYGDKYFKINNASYADSTFFSMFSFKMKEGKPSDVLNEPYKLVLTESTAQTIFGKDNPIGKLIRVGNRDIYKVSGIAEDPPKNSQIKFNALLSFSSLYKSPYNYMDWNGGNQYYTYIKLKKNISPTAFESKLPDFMWQHINRMLSKIKISYKAYLQPLSEIHLKYNEASTSGLTNIYIFSAVAFLVILIACINFINLSIARSTKRIKEIGVRKILGAKRKTLFVQFLTEYLIISLFVLFLTAVLLEVFYPYYQNLIGENLTLVNPFNLTNLFQTIGVILLIAIITGSYPSLYLSSLKPVNSLKGNVSFTGKKVRLRNILLVFQFIVSVSLIICTIFVARQLNFVKEKDLGYNKSNLLIIPLLNNEVRKNVNLLKEQIVGLPGVINTSASSEIPYNGFTSNGYFPEGYKTPLMFHALDVDQNFMDTYGIKIVDGRNFIRGRSSDSTSYIINESLAKQLNWENPIGKYIARDRRHKIIGVVKDFNYSSLHSSIQPLLITERPFRNLYDYLTIKVADSNVKDIVQSIRKTWLKINPSQAFEYSFLDEEIDQLYESEGNFGKIFLTFSILALVLALFGLFSLSSLTTEQKTKEIGIRKVLGDTSTGITVRILKGYFLLVLVADIIAFPLAFYFINNWLQNFAYHIKIGIDVFLLSGLLTIVFGISVVIIHAVRASERNPVESLRYE